MELRAVAVIGAGIMGSGIAAHLADRGLAVSLLDIDCQRAEAGLAEQCRLGGFSDPDAPSRITTGSMTDDIDAISTADWTIEAAAESIDVKRAIFAAVERHRKAGSIVSSNTSTILLADLIENQTERFAEDFLVTHFFNPPRTMHLLELVAGTATRREAVDTIRDLAEKRLGKVVVEARDTPGFIANRIGNFWMAAALQAAIDLELDAEMADAIIGRPFGTPLGVFALLDLVGIDLAASVWRSLQTALPADDAIQHFSAEPPLLARMIAEGRTGRKARAGFTRRLADGSFETLDLTTGLYRPQRKSTPNSADMAEIIRSNSAEGRYASRVWGQTLAYARALVPETIASAELADLAMRHGYGWRHGPFELLSTLGDEWLPD